MRRSAHPDCAPSSLRERKRCSQPRPQKWTHRQHHHNPFSPIFASRGENIARRRPLGPTKPVHLVFFNFTATSFLDGDDLAQCHSVRALCIAIVPILYDDQLLHRSLNRSTRGCLVHCGSSSRRPSAMKVTERNLVTVVTLSGRLEWLPHGAPRGYGIGPCARNGARSISCIARAVASGLMRRNPRGPPRQLFRVFAEVVLRSHVLHSSFDCALHNSHVLVAVT